MKFNSTYLFIILAVLVIGGIVGARFWGEAQPGQYDEFAQCIADTDTTFYGAFWCPHCEDQKQLFGNSAKLLPYVECSTADRQGQTQACIDAGIEGYPTWDFPNGERQRGVLSFQQLAEQTGCELPAS